MKITQHRQMLFSGDKPLVATFNTTEELLNVPFVKSNESDKNFHKFSLDDDTLMAEYNEGRTWYVVGYLEDVTHLDLDPWVPIR